MGDAWKRGDTRLVKDCGLYLMIVYTGRAWVAYYPGWTDDHPNDEDRRDGRAGEAALLRKIRARLDVEPWRESGHHCNYKSALHAAIQMIDAALGVGVGRGGEV